MNFDAFFFVDHLVSRRQLGQFVGLIVLTSSDPLEVDVPEFGHQFFALHPYCVQRWVRQSENDEANELAQVASGYKVVDEEKEVQIHLLEPEDWRADIFNYLKDSARGAPKRIRYKAMKYVLMGDDLFFRTMEGLLLKCLGPADANWFLHEVHEGTCGTHQSAHKMKWLIRRSGYYWPTMLEDCFKYYRGCQACQRFGKIQMAPASVMNPIVKPWPFRGWGMDMIGKINPPSSKGHQWTWLSHITSRSG